MTLYFLQSDKNMTTFKKGSFSSLNKLAEELVEYLKKNKDPRIEGKYPWKDYIYHQASGFGSTYNKSLPAHKRERAKLRPSDNPYQKLRN